MKLKLRNIGLFDSEQEIMIEGITILAGLNGSGKSTFGKLLYCIFNSFKDIEKKTIRDRGNAIDRLIWNKAREYNIELKNYRNQIVPILEKVINEKDLMVSGKIMGEFIGSLFSDKMGIDDKNILLNKINEILKIEDKAIRERILENQIEAEFGDQIKNISDLSEKAYAELLIKDKSIAFSCLKETIEIEKYISLIKDVVYIDDPNVLDDFRHLFVINASREKDHKWDLLGKLIKNNDDSHSSVDQILIDKKIRRIEDKLDTVCEGEVSLGNAQQFVYKSARFKDGLNLSNMATGLKTFAILKMLLKKGCLEENGIIIFDEPEIHLHPEWQRLFAEIIVLLQKEFGMHILISTHSSDFLSFLELYMNIYDIKEKTKLYLLGHEEKAFVKDVSEDWDIVYKQLGNPFIKASEELDAINDSE